MMAADDLVPCTPTYAFWHGRTYFTTIEREPANEDEAPIEILVEYRISSPGCPAQTYGPPENCYPAEPTEIEIVGAVGDFGLIVLRDAEVEEVEDWVSQNPPEDDDEPDWDRWDV